MKKFIQDNAAIVAAIVLPLALIVVLMVSSFVVNASIDDPKYDFFIATNYYGGGNHMYEFDVINDKLIVTYHAPATDKNGNRIHENKPRLWRIHVPEMVAEEISLVPGNLPNLGGLQVTTLQQAPDGYVFNNRYDYDGNLMSDMFGGRSSRGLGGLVKGAKHVPLKEFGADNGYYNTQFVAWVVGRK